MAIALAGTPTSQPGASISASTLTITVPTGSVGDILFVHMVSTASGSAGAPLITASQTGWSIAYTVDNQWMNSKVFYRFVASGDPTSYTFTTNAAVVIAATCVRYSGVSSSTPFRFLNVTEEGSDTATTHTAVTFPPVDNVQSTDLTVCFVSGASGSSNKTQATAIPTPTGWTNVVNRLGPTSSTTSSSHIAMATFSEVAGIDTPTVSGLQAGVQAAISLVLIAASNVVPPSAGGTISFVNIATTGQSAISGTIAVNVPTGVVDGDLLLATMSNSSGTGLWSAPSGWEPIPITTNCSQSQGTTSQLADADAALFYKFASSEPSNYTFTCTKTNHANAALIVAYRGVRNPYPIHLMNVTKSQGTTNTSSTTSPAPFALNTMNVINSDMLVVNFYDLGNDVTSGAITITLPASPWNARGQASGSVAAAFNPAVSVADKLGATDTPTATASVSSGWIVFSVALAPAPVVSGPSVAQLSGFMPFFM